MANVQKTLDAAVENYVRKGRMMPAFFRVRKRFPTDAHFFRAMNSDLRISYIINEWVSSLDKKIQTGVRDLYSKDFLPVDRDKAAQIFKETNERAKALMYFYPYKSEDALINHLSRTTGLSYSYVLGVVSGHRMKLFTHEALRLHTRVTASLEEAIKAIEQGSPLRDIPFMFQSEITEPLYTLIVRASTEIIGEPHNGALQAIIKGFGKTKGLRHFTKVKYLQELVEKIKNSHGFPNLEATQRFIYEMAGIKKSRYQPKTNKTVHDPGNRSPSGLHHRLYAVALILHYARTKVPGNSRGVKYPVNHGEYRKVFDELHSIGLSGFDLAIALKPVLRKKPEDIFIRYIKSHDYIDFQQYKRLRKYAECVMEKR